MNHPILQVRNLQVRFPLPKPWLARTERPVIKAVDGLSLHVAEGEILGLVGESGCGKSTFAKAAVGLAPVAGGDILFDGAPIAESIRRNEPRDVQMVFQDPYASLNPRMTVAAALTEAVRTRRPLRGAELAAEIAELMERVGLSPRLLRKYPHEFSGGQRQRIAIARALAAKPRVMIADEPVSALDVSIQSQIINLIRSLSEDLNLAVVFISHDLSVVHHISDRIVVMYLGRDIESGKAGDVIRAPSHPYTRALVSAVPEPDPERETRRKRIILKGDPPSPIDLPPGCRFHPRCPHGTPACNQREPEPVETTPGHRVACIRTAEIPPCPESRP